MRSGIGQDSKCCLVCSVAVWMVGVDKTWSHDLDLSGHCFNWLQKTLHSIHTCGLLALPTLEVTGDGNVSLGGPITLLEGST